MYKITGVRSSSWYIIQGDDWMNTWIIWGWVKENLFSIYFIWTYSFRKGLIGKLNNFLCDRFIGFRKVEWNFKFSFTYINHFFFFFQTLFIYIFSPVRPFNTTLSNINRIIKKLKSRKKKDTTHVRKNKK